MKTLFQEDLFKNENNDKPWMKSDTDRMLDLYFSGNTPDRIAYLMKRNTKAINRQLETFTYNESGRADRYEMLERDSRRGKRLTENEKVFIAAHTKRGVDLESTARVLCRRVEEIRGESIAPSRIETQIKTGTMKQVAPTLDQLMAHRYLYWSAKKPIISNRDYDDLKEEEIEYGCGRVELDKPASDKACDYPPHIRSLAYYMQYKFMVQTGEWKDVTSLPYDSMLHAEANHPEAKEAHAQWSKDQKRKGKA